MRLLHEGYHDKKKATGKDRKDASRSSAITSEREKKEGSEGKEQDAIESNIESKGKESNSDTNPKSEDTQEDCDDDTEEARVRVPQLGMAPATQRGLHQLQEKIDYRRGLRARQRLYEFYKYI